MAFGKRQLILAALVLALSAAVYLNWQFSEDREFSETDILTDTRELGQAQFVNNSPTDEPQQEGKPQVGGSGKNEEKAPAASEYFARVKKDRLKARDEATEMIKEVLENVKSTEETKAEAIKQAALLARNIEQEVNIESLIKAKGFKDCLAFLQNDECSVVVSADGLNESSAMVIKDIIYGQGGVSVDKIKILEAK